MIIISVLFVGFIFFLLFLLFFFRKEIDSLLLARKIKLKDFQCQRCDKCCEFDVILSYKDVEELLKTGKDESEFCSRKFGVRMLKKKKNGRCVFFDTDQGHGRCAVQDNKPEQCRRFPFPRYIGVFKGVDPRCEYVKRLHFKLKRVKPKKRF